MVGFVLLNVRIFEIARSYIVSTKTNDECSLLWQ